MRQNNDTTRGARVKQSLDDVLADLGRQVIIYRNGSPIGSAPGIVDAEAHSRISGASLAAFRFLYRVYLRMPVDVAVADTLFGNDHWFLVRDVDAGISFPLVMTCLCERVAGP